MFTRKRLLLALKILISSGLIALLYSRIEMADLRDQITTLRVWPLLLFFVILVINTILSAAKWHALLAADGVHIPLRKLVVSYLIGTFFNVFLPSNIGGDGYRILDISRRSGKTVNTVASVFADRLSGFLALSFMGLLFPLLGWRLIETQWGLNIPLLGECVIGARWVLLIPLLAFSGFASLVVLLWQQSLLRWIAGRIGGKWGRKITAILDKFLASISAYSRRRSVLVKIMAISFCFQFLVIVAIYCLGLALSLELPFLPFCVFVPLISLLEAIPITIFGIGLREFGYTLFMTAVAHDAADGVALALVYTAATLVYCAVGGILFLMRRHSAPPAEAADATSEA